MILTLTRQNLTITGTYTPQQKSLTGLKLGATFNSKYFIDVDGIEGKVWGCEWIGLKEQYLMNTKN